MTSEASRIALISEANISTLFPVVKYKGLDPYSVPAQQKPFLPAVVKAKCKHAVKSFDELFIKLFIEMNQDFAVTLGSETMPLSFNSSQLPYSCISLRSR